MSIVRNFLRAAKKVGSHFPLYLAAFPYALLSWFVLRLAQDFYHWLAHSELPGLLWLNEWHMKWHHRIYSKEYHLRVSPEELCKAHWFNELPESIFMLLAGALLTLGLWYFCVPLWWTSIYGICHTFWFHTLRSIRIGSGDVDLWWAVTPEHQTAITAVGSPFFKEAPAQYIVNALYHLNHHDWSRKTHLCAAFPWLDQLLGTAFTFKSKKIHIHYGQGSEELAQDFAALLPVNSNRIALMAH